MLTNFQNSCIDRFSSKFATVIFKFPTTLFTATVMPLKLQ